MEKSKVAQYFIEKGLPLEPVFTGEDTSTVEKAAQVLGVKEGQIAKSLAVRLPHGVGVLVMKGTARLDNQKFKNTFKCKAKMLSVEETLEETGFPVGGVCPFALPEGVQVYIDESIREYTIVYPAAGTRDSAVKVTVENIMSYTGGQWVDVCKNQIEEGK